tara:strand:+ start:908 stop:1804 length:897 start_codon:yes stop_codon:yes gene_type:complete
MSPNINKYKKKCYICRKNSLNLKIKNPKDLEYFYLRKGSYFLCNNCGTLSQFPLPSNTQIKKFYNNDYQNYSNSNNFLLKFISKIFFYLKFKDLSLGLKNKKKKIIDYGCGSGEILNNFFKNGYKNILGVDYVRSSNLNKKIKFSKNIKSAKGKFDLIILNHIIEHSNNPEKLIKVLKNKLSINGVIIGSTPNSRDMFLKIFEKYWGCLHFPYHIHLFSKNSLKILCHKNNLKIKFYFDIQSTGLSMSLENLIKDIFKIKKKGRMIFYPLVLIICTILNFMTFLIAQNTSILKFKIYK